MSYGSFARAGAIAGLLLALSAAQAFAAEYRDPKGVFGLAYDDSTWSVDKEDTNFGLECREEACKGASASCTFIKQWIPLLPATAVMAVLAGGDFAKGQVEALAEATEAQEKELAARTGRKTWDDRYDVPAHLVDRPTQRQIGAHSFMHAEIRMTAFGKGFRYVSFATAGANHMIQILCQAPEAAIGEWRPRFDALMAALSTPAPKSR
jgi:hypothetical protein